MGSCGNLVESFIFPGTETSDRKIEILRFPDDRRILSDGFKAAVHVAVLATVRYFRTTAPQVPCDSDRGTRICPGRE